MHGIISLLTPPHDRMVKDIWNKLEKECSLAGVLTTPYPHFSWQISEEYREPQTEEIVRNIVKETKSFKVRTNGLGIFSGPSPVIYIPIIKTPALNHLHQKLWKQLTPTSKEPHLLYGPQNWVPHVTLIFRDENQQAIRCGLEMLMFQSFDWEIEINNLSLAVQLENQIATLGYRHGFIP